MSNVTKLESGTLVAGGRPAPIIPQNLDDAYRLSKAIQLSGLAPPGFKTTEQIMIAIMHGLEIGLTPLQSLQRLAVINNRVTIWGDGAIGLVRGSGLCEYVNEEIRGEGDGRHAWCEVKRRGEPNAIIRMFSVKAARQAGLWGKPGPWTQFPDRMLQMRARAFALRDGFADVLGGLYLREEIDDAPKRDAVTTESIPYVERLTGPDQIDEKETIIRDINSIDMPPGIMDEPDYQQGIRDYQANRHEPHYEIEQDETRMALWRHGYEAAQVETEDR